MSSELVEVLLGGAYDNLPASWHSYERFIPDPEAILDSQSIITTAQDGPKETCAHKNVKGRMVHCTIYTMGLLPAMAITSANVHDREAAMGMRDLVEAQVHGVGVVVVDAGYAGQHARSVSFKHGVDVRVVRHSGNRNAATWVDNLRWPPHIEVHGRGFQVLLKGWKIERTYACNDRPRCLSKEHDRNLAVSEGWVCLVEGRQRLRRITSVTQRA